MIWEENCLLPKNGRSALGWGKLLLALGSLEIFWVLFPPLFKLTFLLIYISFFPLLLESLFYICFNLIILTRLHFVWFVIHLCLNLLIIYFWNVVPSIFSHINIFEKRFALVFQFSKLCSRNIFRGNCLLKTSGSSALGARVNFFLDHYH